MLAHLGKIDLEGGAGDADGGAAAQQFVNLGRGEQRIGGDRPAGQVGAAEGALFDQDDGDALAGSGEGRGNARRAAANDADFGVSGCPACVVFRSQAIPAAETVAMIAAFR